MRGQELRGVVRGRRLKTTMPELIECSVKPESGIRLQRWRLLRQRVGWRIIELYQTEVVRQQALGHIGVVEFATLEWVNWFNHRRLLESIGNVSPAEVELAYHQSATLKIRLRL